MRVLALSGRECQQDESRFAVSARSSRVPDSRARRARRRRWQDGHMDSAMVERLAAGEGWALLQSLPPYDEAGSLHLQDRLRDAGFAADLVAAAMTQSRLRARGTDKFGDFAAGMLFTADGLEQATRLAIAARHAHRYAAAGVRDVYDLGCGLGSDAMAFAGLDLTVHAVDADDTTARIAAVNLRHWPSARVTHALAEDVQLPQGEGRRHLGLWLDPARRVTGVADISGRTKRVFSLDAISPSWSQVLDFAAQVPATGAKLSPAFPHGSVPSGAEAQWTSWHGEVLECAVWWGPLVATAGRTAAVCTETSTSVVTDQDAVDGAELATGVGYVSSGVARELPWARRFRVVEAMPLSTKRLARWLRDHGHDRVTI